MSMDYIEGGVMMPDTSSKDAELRVLEQKIYAEIPVLLAEKGLSDVQHEAIMDDRKESVELIMRLIKQYGIQERINEGSVLEVMCHDNGPYTGARELTYTDFMLARDKRKAELTALKDKEKGDGKKEQN